MSSAKSHPRASSEYNSAKYDALRAIKAMTKAMKEMGAEHIFFHGHDAVLQKRLEDMKEDNGGKELDVEVVRSTAVDQFLSDGNLPKVMALGRFEMEVVLKAFKEEEIKLGKLQKETARRVEALAKDQQTKRWEQALAEHGIPGQ